MIGVETIATKRILLPGWGVAGLLVVVRPNLRAPQTWLGVPRPCPVRPESGHFLTWVEEDALAVASAIIQRFPAESAGNPLVSVP